MEVAPFHSDVADAPEGVIAHWLTTADDLRIRVAHWPLEGAKGTVVLFTGRSEFVEKYGRVVRDLRAAGYAVIANDWRGQGMSDRMHADRGLGHVGSFSDYQRDVAAIMDHVRALDLPRPHFLLAHSLGGGIGLQALMNGLPVTAAAFSAPMFGIEAPRLKRMAIVAISAIARALGLGTRVVPGYSTEITLAQTPFEENVLTHDREAYEFMQHQVRTYPQLGIGGPSLNWIYEAVRATDRMTAKASPNVPALTLLGDEECVVQPSRIHDRMGRWPNGRLDLVPGGYHEMLFEVPEIRSRVIEAIVAHFDAQLSKDAAEVPAS